MEIVVYNGTSSCVYLDEQHVMVESKARAEVNLDSEVQRLLDAGVLLRMDKVDQEVVARRRAGNNWDTSKAKATKKPRPKK